MKGPQNLSYIAVRDSMYVPAFTKAAKIQRLGEIKKHYLQIITPMLFKGTFRKCIAFQAQPIKVIRHFFPNKLVNI